MEESLKAGLLEVCGVSIVEVNKDYTVETSKTVGTDAAVIGTSATVTEDDIKKPVTVAYTNTKTGTIPTGVILSVAGLLVVGIFAVIGFVFFGLRSKRRYDED